MKQTSREVLVVRASEGVESKFIRMAVVLRQ
jgi:hypothetical protein